MRRDKVERAREDRRVGSVGEGGKVGGEEREKGKIGRRLLIVHCLAAVLATDGREGEGRGATYRIWRRRGGAVQPVSRVMLTGGVLA
jgi:hypothetical protein